MIPITEYEERLRREEERKGKFLAFSWIPVLAAIAAGILAIAYSL